MRVCRGMGLLREGWAHWAVVGGQCGGGRGRRFFVMVDEDVFGVWGSV